MLLSHCHPVFIVVARRAMPRERGAPTSSFNTGHKMAPSHFPIWLTIVLSPSENIKRKTVTLKKTSSFNTCHKMAPSHFQRAPCDQLGEP